MPTYGGWTGKTLRVNLTSGKISTEDTIARFKDVLGGTGIGYRVLWDEVPAGTGSFDQTNKIIVAVGPLTGTGTPCGGRTSVTTIFPTVVPTELVATGHMGGYFGAELKYAGWDAVIVEGVAPRPVYVAIIDSQVEIRDASHLWGDGIYRATSSICQELGPETQVAAIGQAGEHLVRLASLVNSFSHSAGGVGGVFGSKRLKAIAVRGSGSVRIAADRAAWKALVQQTLGLLGANNQHVVPSTPQWWSDFSSPGSRWTARKGLFWGAARPPVETGECPPGDSSRIGFRTAKATYDLGPNAEKYTVRMGGCASCPIRCHSHLDVPGVEAKYGLSRYAAQTCVGWGGRSFFKGFPDGQRGEASIEAAVVGKHLADDLGVWTHYSQLQRDFRWAYYAGVIRANLPAREYASIPWDKYERGDPAFLSEIYRRIAFRQGELGDAFAEGSGRLAERWKFPPEYFADPAQAWWKMGHPRHHAAEEGGQVGVLINLMYNRDAQCHSHSNFLGCGLPTRLLQGIAAKAWGEGAVDEPDDCRPMTPAKARFALWAVARKELHDSLTLCNWVWPLAASPIKARGYEGDLSLEAQFYSAVTGDVKDAAELDRVAERIFVLHRALTVRDMKTADMRRAHDTAPSWLFDLPADKAPFTPGHSRMDRADIEKAKDLFYELLGWDRATGAPTRASLERLGLKDVADKLAALDLLPGGARGAAEGVSGAGPARMDGDPASAGASAGSGPSLPSALAAAAFATPPASPADAARTIRDVVRHESAVYPRPTPIASFSAAPYDLPEATVEEAVARLRAEPGCEDIGEVTASDGSRFLFSSRHLHADRATSRAEWMAVGRFAQP
jgi:aldehyde:ferredoxin oxidoreductase